MEELVTRPLEQQLSAVAGPRADELDVVSEGNSQHPAELRLGHGPQRSDGRHPHAHRPRARPPAGGRRSAGRPEVRLERACRSWASASRAPTARSTASRCASWPRTSLSPRLERVAGVAAVTVNGGLRRQIHVELSREKITALDLSVDRVVNVLRTENQNIPIGEVYQGDRSLPAPQPGPVPEPRRDPQPGRA